MAKKQTIGATWLHNVLNKTPRCVWTNEERRLRRLAEKWEDEGIQFEEILERIEGLREEGGAL